MKLIARHLLGLAVGASLSLSVLAAQAAVIDIDDIAGVQAGTVVDTQFAGVTISRTDSGGGPPIALDTDNAPVGDPDLQAPFTNSNPTTPGLSDGPDNPGFILVSNLSDTGCGDEVCDNVNDDGGGSTLSFVFTAPSEIVSLDLFDLDEGTSSATLELLSSGGTKVVSGADVGDGASVSVDIGTFFGLTTGQTFDELRIRFSGSGGVDNIVFNTPGTDIPEPATLALVGSGLLAAGALTRRRRRV